MNNGPLANCENAKLGRWYAEAGFPKARLHDCRWPSPDVVDVSTIFPLAHLDPDDPRTYLAAILAVKSRIVFRLGQSIAPWSKYHTHPPADMDRFAKICVNIIRHYNHGSADAFHHGIWVGPGRGRKSTRTGAHGLVALLPFEFLDRLADLIPQPRKHRHRYHGVFASNHLLRPSVTALAIPPQRRLPAGVGFLRTGGSQADDGQDGFARVNPAPHTPRPTARTAANLASSRAAHRLGRTRPGP